MTRVGLVAGLLPPAGPPPAALAPVRLAHRHFTLFLNPPKLVVLSIPDQAEVRVVLRFVESCLRENGHHGTGGVFSQE